MKHEADFEILALVDPRLYDAVRLAASGINGCSLRLDSGQGSLNELAQADQVDLVLLDPDAVAINAADGISMLKAAWPHCEIVLLLGNQDITVDIELMKIGAYGAIPKPPSQEDLSKLIRGLMEKN
ncbi:MAG TPA: response regulator, partial [Spirochaetales bacterium]|nr:response regulator [Spirochaetales bacterium]